MNKKKIDHKRYCKNCVYFKRKENNGHCILHNKYKKDHESCKDFKLRIIKCAKCGGQAIEKFRGEFLCASCLNPDLPKPTLQLRNSSVLTVLLGI